MTESLSQEGNAETSQLNTYLKFTFLHIVKRYSTFFTSYTKHVTTHEIFSHRSTSLHKSDNRRRSKGKRPTDDSSSESYETSDDEVDERPPRRAGRKTSVDPFGGDTQKVADLESCRNTRLCTPHTSKKAIHVLGGGTRVCSSHAD